MDFISDADLLSKLLATIIAILTATFGFFRWVRPKMKQAASDVRAGRDALVGRDAVYDSITGKELAPALKGIGVRMDMNEQQMVVQAQQMGVLTDAVAKLADSSLRLDDHDLRLKRLEEGMVERVVTRAESTAAWRAVEAIASHPDDTPLSPLGEN
jgi:hypothetical protein